MDRSQSAWPCVVDLGCGLSTHEHCRPWRIVANHGCNRPACHCSVCLDLRFGFHARGFCLPYTRQHQTFAPNRCSSTRRAACSRDLEPVLHFQQPRRHSHGDSAAFDSLFRGSFGVPDGRSAATGRNRLRIDGGKVVARLSWHLPACWEFGMA